MLDAISRTFADGRKDAGMRNYQDRRWAINRFHRGHDTLSEILSGFDGLRVGSRRTKRLVTALVPTPMAFHQTVVLLNRHADQNRTIFTVLHARLSGLA